MIGQYKFRIVLCFGSKRIEPHSNRTVSGKTFRVTLEPKEWRFAVIAPYWTIGSKRTKSPDGRVRSSVHRFCLSGLLTEARDFWATSHSCGSFWQTGLTMVKVNAKSFMAVVTFRELIREHFPSSVSVFQSMSAKLASRLGMRAGSCTAWSTASSPTVRCPAIRLSAAGTTRSTLSSAKPALENTCRARSSST